MQFRHRHSAYSLLPCFSADGAEGVGLEDLAAFLDDVEAVGIEVLEGVDLAGGPADFDVGGLCLVEAEVDAEVVLREVAAASADFVDLDERVSGLGRALLIRSGAVTLMRAPIPVRLDLCRRCGS